MGISLFSREDAIGMRTSGLIRVDAVFEFKAERWDERFAEQMTLTTTAARDTRRPASSIPISCLFKLLLAVPNNQPCHGMQISVNRAHLGDLEARCRAKLSEHATSTH